jgi:hypothetical protein
MKPAFDDSLQLSDDKRSVTAAGPLELSGDETDAYFWIRISQGEVEAIATHDREKEQLQAEFQAARDRLLSAVSTAVGHSLPGAGQPVTPADRETAAVAAQEAAETAVLELGPKWRRTAKARNGKQFRAGTAKAEGWLLVKTSEDEDDPGRNVFWTTNVTLVAKDQV